MSYTGLLVKFSCRHDRPSTCKTSPGFVICCPRFYWKAGQRRSIPILGFSWDWASFWDEIICEPMSGCISLGCFGYTTHSTKHMGNQCGCVLPSGKLMYSYRTWRIYSWFTYRGFSILLVGFEESFPIGSNRQLGPQDLRSLVDWDIVEPCWENPSSEDLVLKALEVVATLKESAAEVLEQVAIGGVVGNRILGEVLKLMTQTNSVWKSLFSLGVSLRN